MKYDIFISYRRNGGFETAKHLYDLLVRDGYKVSFDIDTLREGDFDNTLLYRIDQCKDFVLIIDKHAFDRTLDPKFDQRKDWLRIELAFALRRDKNVIPVLLSGVEGFPDNLPDDIVGVVTKNGPQYNQYYFDEFYNRLKAFFHCKPNMFFAGNRLRSLTKGLMVLFVVFLFVSICLSMWNNLSSDKHADNVVADTSYVNPVMGAYRYSGQVDENGLPHGKGLAKFAQGDTYEGYFLHGNFDGECTYINYEVGEKFVGTYKDNRRSHGTYVWEDGTYFTGSFKDNTMEKGVLYDVNGNILKEY